MSYVTFLGIKDYDKEPIFYTIIEADEANDSNPIAYQVPANHKAVSTLNGYDDYARDEQQAAEMFAEKVYFDWDCPSRF